MSVTYGTGSGEVSLACTPTTLHTLTVTKDGTGSGTVTSTPAGINCGESCAHPFPLGTTVTLTASPDANMAFTGWSGACTGAASCTVTMTEAASVTATFATTQVLSVEVVSVRLCTTFGGCDNGGSGSVVSHPPGINCAASDGASRTCFARFPTGASVTLSVHPQGSSQFAGWSGACTGMSLTCTVTMDQERFVRAGLTA